MTSSNILFRIHNLPLISINSLDELINNPNYDDIIWLKINNVSFTNKFIFPTKLKELYINKCKNINLLHFLPLNIRYVEITHCNCTSVHNLFMYNDYKYIETLNLSFNRITNIPINLPNNLISLNLSNNDINKLPIDICFPVNIHEIDLSFNQLQDLPEWLLDLNVNTNITLMPNKFWFNSYSDISLNRTIHDYHINIANRFFNNVLREKLEKTRNITTNYVTRINPNIETEIIRNNFENTTFRPRPDRINKITANVKTTGEQDQNVHNSNIQDSFSKSVSIIMENKLPKIINFLDEVFYYYIFDSVNILSNTRFINHINVNCNLPSIVSRNGVTYGEIFERIWAISKNHKDIDEIRKVLRQEIEAGYNVCFTGKVTRLVNALTGFIEGIQIGYSENEQINNIVITIMRKKQTNPEINVYDEINNALTELNISEEKKKIWLDALE